MDPIDGKCLRCGKSIRYYCGSQPLCARCQRILHYKSLVRLLEQLNASDKYNFYRVMDEMVEVGERYKATHQNPASFFNK